MVEDGTVVSQSGDHEELRAEGVPALVEARAEAEGWKIDSCSRQEVQALQHVRLMICQMGSFFLLSA